MKKGWFKLPGQDGDRTLEQQLIGLESIQWHGKTVLDLGCAEGMISKYAALCGAERTVGLDIVPAHIERARKECDCLPCSFSTADLNVYPPFQSPYMQFDIVLMLAILHKLKDPVAVVRNFARLADEMIVIRLPPKDRPWVIVDARSGDKPHNISKALWQMGWAPSKTTKGTFDEWIGFYTKVD